jgi:thiol-disulfide isomerase/thioredoxin
MFSDRPRYSGAGVFLLLLGVLAIGCNTKSSKGEKKHSDFRVRLVDENGSPVNHADVGLYTYFGDTKFSETGWKYDMHTTSGEDGIAQFADGALRLNGLSLVARQVDRKLVAMESLNPSDCANLYTVRMRPECRVTGTLICKQLEAKGKSLQGINVNVFKEGKYAIEYWCNQSPAFEFIMPPGEYKLSARSDLSGTYEVARAITIPSGKTTHDLGSIELPLTALKQLQGEKAPELCDIVAWKNSKPLTLSELQGKVVLLEFWGWWCGSCVRDMPELFRLYDKYHEDGLVIIGIHIDTTAKIDTADKLDKKLANARKDIWNGRDIPFPVAMVLEREVPFPAGVAQVARCVLAADYGVWRYPTGVLIDRKGRVVGMFRGTSDQITMLEDALNK